MNKHLVSVLVPTYNHVRFIEGCLISVAAQDYDDVELVLVDDCSGDGTFEVARDFLNERSVRTRFRRIVCEQNTVNLGAHASINRAVALAKGDFISLINSDDLYGPRRISIMMKKLLKSQSKLAFSKTRCIDSSGLQSYGEEADNIPTTVAVRALTNMPSLSFACLRYQPAISTGNMIFQRALYDKVGGFIPLRYCHDWDFLLQAVFYTEPVYIDDPLYEYRLHGGNSFRELSDVARHETEVVLTRYFKKILLRGADNQMAPSPQNWPHVFEQFLRLFELEGIWNRVNTGHPRNSRVVDGNVLS